MRAASTDSPSGLLFRPPGLPRVIAVLGVPNLTDGDECRQPPEAGAAGARCCKCRPIADDTPWGEVHPGRVSRHLRKEEQDQEARAREALPGAVQSESDPRPEVRRQAAARPALARMLSNSEGTRRDKKG